MTVTAPKIEALNWADFLDTLEWYQGEHVTAIGPTKSGKTTLFRELFKRSRREGTHPWQAVIATKKRDEVLDAFLPDGFVRMPYWNAPEADVTPRIMLAPPIPSAEEYHLQAQAIRNALTSIYAQGGWMILLDELKHIADFLGLKREVELLLHQGRSAGITVVSAVQRPRHVPLMAYDQADHIYMWESRDANIRDRLSEIGGRVNPEVVEQGLRSLPDRHSFLYVRPSTGRVVQSKVEI